MALAHYDTFRVQLANTHSAFGHALWEPDPGDFPPVEVGDVGFISQGKFHRLFSALLPEDHPSHDTFGVPEDHELLQPSMSNHINRGTLHPNNFCLYGVKVRSGETNFNASEPPAASSVDVSMSCSRKHGAVLFLPVAARREDTFSQAHFRTWIITHIDSWFNFTQRHGLGIPMEDIVLVTGCHRTRSWSNIAFYEGQAGARVSFRVQVPSIHGATVHWRVSSQQVQGAVLCHGPSGENLPNTQCIFVRGFRVKRTFKLFPRVRGAAEPIPDPSWKDDEQETEAVSIAGVPEYRDPLHVLLDYLAEREPNCDLALVHDDDLERILRVGNETSLETLQPAEVMNYLQSSKLEIEVAVMPDPLPSNDESSSSRIDANRMKVAMLSDQLKGFETTAAYPSKVTSTKLPALTPKATVTTTTTSNATSNSSKTLRRSPRPFGLTPTSSRNSPLTVKGLEVPRDILQSPEADVKMGIFEMADSLLKETSSLIKSVPYLGVIAGIFLELAKIKGEVDRYRESWGEVMYGVIKVADLVRHFGAACQRHGLCDEATFPQDFIGTIKALETELVQVVGVMSHCRGKRRFELFKKGLARNDMVKEIQKCDRQMNRMFDRFLAAMVMDIRFQQLVSERPQSPPTPMYMATPIPSVTSDSTLTPCSPFPGPIQPQVFFGRDDELKAIVELIFSSAVAARIAILGPSGVGKTTLAHAVLTHEKLVSRFGDSCYFVPCEELNSRVALLVALANTLPILQTGTTVDNYSVGLDQRVLSALGSEECILCLDNFESPWDQPGPKKKAVERLLADITALSSVTVLITMRGGERPKETAWTLPMLPPLTNFSRGAAKRTWESIAGNYDEWAEKLIDAVDCLPLAVTQLGSLAQATSAETLWDRWQKENIALVETSKGDKLARLEHSIALSIESDRMAADVSSKRLLGILSMLPDGIPESSSPEFQRLFPEIPDISQSLGTLLECSLAARTADKRVHVHWLVQLYCEQHDLASPEDRRALRDYYVALASRSCDDLSLELFRGMKMEINNMESILCKSLDWTPLEEITPVIDAIITFTQFCLCIGKFSYVVITHAIEVKGLSDKKLGDCLISLGFIYLCDDKLAIAEDHFTRALVLYNSVQYTVGQAIALTHLGDTCQRLDRLEESSMHYGKGLKLHKELQDLLGQAYCWNSLGHVYLKMDNIQTAKAAFEKALELHKALNNLVGQADDHFGLGNVYYTEALQSHKNMLGRANQLEDPRSIYVTGKYPALEDPQASQGLHYQSKSLTPLSYDTSLPTSFSNATHRPLHSFGAQKLWFKHNIVDQATQPITDPCTDPPIA